MPWRPPGEAVLWAVRKVDMELKSVSEARGFYMELILLGADQELHKYLLNEKKK